MKPEAMEQFFTSMAAAHAHQSAAAEALTNAFNAIYGARESADPGLTTRTEVFALPKAEIRAAEAAMVAEVAKPKPSPKAKAEAKPEPTPEPVAEVAPVVETKPEPVKVEAKPEPKAEAAPTDAKLDINDVRKLLIAVQTMHSVGGDMRQGRLACIEILKEHADGEIGLPKVAAKYYPAIAAACQASLAAGAV